MGFSKFTCFNPLAYHALSYQKFNFGYQQRLTHTTVFVESDEGPCSNDKDGVVIPTKVVDAKEQNKEKFIKKIQIIAYMNVSTYHSLSSNVVSLAKLSPNVYFSLLITTAFFDFALPPPYMHSRRPLSSASFLSLVGVQPTLQSNHGTKELKGKSKKKIFSQKFYTNGKQSVRFRGIIRESDNDTNNLQRKMNLAIMVKSSEKRRVQK